MNLLEIKDENYFYGQVPVRLSVSQEKFQKILAEFPAPIFPKSDDVFRLDEKKPRDNVKDILLLLHSVQLETASNGNPFLKIQFGNSQSNVPAKAWNNIEQMQEMLDQHIVFKVSGVVEQFPLETGPKSIKVSTIAPVEGDINPISLLPSPDFEVESLIVELYTYLEEFQEPHKAIALHGLKMFWDEFSIKPAAKRMHHAYLCGLLKHTVGLMRIIRFLRDGEVNPYIAMLKLITVIEKKHSTEIYSFLGSDSNVDLKNMPWNNSIDHIKGLFASCVGMKDKEINFDLLLCTAFLHDLGKIYEITHAGEGDKFSMLFPFLEQPVDNQKKSTGIALDDLGVLVGHVAYGTFMFKDIVEKNNIKMSIQDFHLYLHNILCHHGKIEWGVPVRLQTPESVILHFADFLDSRWEMVEAQAKKDKEK